MSIFGDLERFLADLYPYRVPLTLGGVLVGAAVMTIVVRRGWHRPAMRWVAGHPLPAALGALLFLVVTVPTGYMLLSPLWERTTLVEASPLDVAAVVASDGGAGTEAGSGASASDDGGTSDGGASGATAVTGGGVEAVDAPRLVSAGEFGGADDFHFARGQALIVETAPGEFTLRFEDFSIRNGPNLYVYLSADPNQPSADAVRLGTLKATDGAFNYELPSGVNPSALPYAMVWCDRFAVLFATAALGN